MVTTRYRVNDLSLELSAEIPNFQHLDGGGPAYAWNSLSTFSRFPDEISYMTDVIGNQGKFNPVSHRSLSGHLDPIKDWTEPPYSDGHWTNWIGFGASRKKMQSFHFPNPYFEFIKTSLIDRYPWFPQISAAMLSDWSIEAFNKFHDQVPTTISLANSLYELKDMKGLIPSVDRLSLSKTVGNNFLAFEFGVLPFVSDIKAILAISDSVDKRIKHLLETQGHSTNLSFERDLPIAEDFFFNISFEDPQDFGDSGNRYRFKRTGAKAHFHCGGKLFQDLSDLSDSMAKLKGLAASGGFNHPARVIWNAIPYSFVVDWFFHVGKLLDSLTVQPFGGTYEVTDVSYSVKTEAIYIVTQEMHGTQYVPGDNQVGKVLAKSYERKVGFPASSLFLTDANLSPTQQALALAMLNQRRR